LSLPDPKVFWIVIGTNDLASNWCTPEAVLIGILGIIENLRASRPSSIIVINSILPRSFDKRSGRLFLGSNGAFGLGRGKLSLLARRGYSVKTPPPIWEDIVMINKRLKRYSRSKAGVVFYDATHIFLQKEGSNRVSGKTKDSHGGNGNVENDSNSRTYDNTLDDKINNDNISNGDDDKDRTNIKNKKQLVIGKKTKIDRNLMGDFLHPTSLGYKMWGEGIVQVLDELLRGN